MSDEKPKRSVLGRGLGALIPTSAGAAGVAAAGGGAGSKDERREFFRCAVADIRPNASQPRRHFDEEALRELGQSIAESGLIQPLVVRQVGSFYELIAGERRWRACQLVGITEVPVVVRELADEHAFVLALVENIQREDLNPIEEALAYQRLMDEFSMTQQAVAEKVGKSRPAVANTVRLLNLPSAVRDMLASGQLTTGHAKILVAMPADEAEELAHLIVAHELSVREAEELVRQAKSSEEAAPEPEKTPAKKSPFRDDVFVRDVSEKLQSRLGTRVKVKDTRGKGRIEIHYDNYDVLQSVLDLLDVKIDS